MLNQYQHNPYGSNQVNGLLELIRLAGLMMSTNPDTSLPGYPVMSANNYIHGNGTVVDDLLEELIERFTEISGSGGGGGGLFLEKKPNLTSIDDTGIADGEVCIYDLTGKKIQTANRKFSEDGTLGADSDTLVPTERAVKTYAVTHNGAVVAGNLPKYVGTSGKQIEDSGISAASLLQRVVGISVFSDPSSSGWTYTNMPLAANIFGGNDRHSFQFLTTNLYTVRLVTTVATIGAAAAVLFLEYSANGGSSWIKIGTGSGDNVISIASTGKKATAWINLPATGDHLFRVGCEGGDGVADPVINHTLIQFRSA